MSLVRVIVCVAVAKQLNPRGDIGLAAFLSMDRHKTEEPACHLVQKNHLRPPWTTIATTIAICIEDRQVRRGGIGINDDVDSSIGNPKQSLQGHLWGFHTYSARSERILLLIINI